jgi:DNA-binding protein HU-beta
MNKGELIAKTAEAGLSKKDAGVALDAAIAAIGDALAKGDSVQLIGFGTFGVKERAAREGRNPRTGEVVKIKASKVPTFKAGKALKDKVAK